LNDFREYVLSRKTNAPARGRFGSLSRLYPVIDSFHYRHPDRLWSRSVEPAAIGDSHCPGRGIAYNRAHAVEFAGAYGYGFGCGEPTPDG
jgi:hypothetical protein